MIKIDDHRDITIGASLPMVCGKIRMIEHHERDEKGANRVTLEISMDAYMGQMIADELRIHIAPATYPHEMEMTMAARALAEAASLMAEAMKAKR